jgi:hypothetical protein
VKFFVYFTGPLPLGVFALTAVFRLTGWLEFPLAGSIRRVNTPSTAIPSLSV